MFIERNCIYMYFCIVKQFLLKIGTFGLALLVLFSAMSFNVSKHYCAGEVASISYFLDMADCDMEQEKKCCDENAAEQKIEQESCCDTEIDFINGSNFLQKETIITATNSNIYFFYSLFKTSLFSLDKPKGNNELIPYSPPILLADIVVLYETYRI